MVIDNSGSMANDQEKLSREFENFVSSISDANYRIGVITTDIYQNFFLSEEGTQGNLTLVEPTGKKFIEKSDPNPDQLFSDLIKRGTSGTSHEHPLFAIKMAIDKRNTVNAGFFRENASLAIVIVTDEDETDFPDETYYSAKNLLSHFENEFKDSKKINAFTIASLSASRVNELSTLTNGFFVDIHDENFSLHLSSISSYMRKSLLPLKVSIPETIILESIHLLVTDPNENIFETNYSIKNNILTISPTPPEEFRIKLDYSFIP